MLCKKLSMGSTFKVCFFWNFLELFSNIYLLLIESMDLDSTDMEGQLYRVVISIE